MKLKEITPQPHRCGTGMCPSVFWDGGENLLIIGKNVENIPDEVQKKIGAGETVISVPVDLIKDLEF